MCKNKDIKMRLILVFFVVFSMVFGSESMAQNLAQFYGQRGGSEYWVGKEEGKPLVIVNIVGGVTYPGLYHVPVDTSIPQVIAYAGGAVKNAEYGDIELRRIKGKDQVEFMEISLKKIMRNTSPMMLVADRDIINIPVSYDLERTATYIGVIAGMTGIILSAIAIRNSNW